MDNKFSIPMSRSVAIEWRDSLNEALGENDIKEQNFNSLQQLKAEIAAFANELDSLYIKDCDLANAKDLVERMRQLSAV